MQKTQLQGTDSGNGPNLFLFLWVMLSFPSQCQKKPEKRVLSRMQCAYVDVYTPAYTYLYEHNFTGILIRDAHCICVWRSMYTGSCR